MRDPLTRSPEGTCPAGDAITELYAVWEVCPPAARYENPPLTHLTLFLTLSGRARLDVGGVSYSHEAGTLIALASGSRIVEQVAPEQPWRVCYLFLRGEWAEQMEGYLRREEPAVYRWDAVPARLKRVFLSVVQDALETPPGWRWQFVGGCAELFGGIYESVRTAPETFLPARLARLIDAAPDEPLGVAQLAARVSLTPRQLAYQMHRLTGEPVALWVRKHRMATAARLLRQGESVTAVARRLGFPNVSHFSRTFKKVAGVAPSAVADGFWKRGLHPAPPDATPPHRLP